MKKIFTFLATALCALGAVAAEPVLSVDFSTATTDDFNAWTVVDVNEDNSTWVFSESATPSRVYYSWNRNNYGDDWFISPAITIPAKGTYALNYEFKGSSYKEAFEVWTGNSATVEGMTTKHAEHIDVIDEDNSNMVLVEAEPGTLHVAFHCVSNPFCYRLYLKSVKLVEASNPVDLCVSEIVSPVSEYGLGNEAVKVKVSNIGHVAVDSYDVAYSIDGGEPVVEHVNVPIAVGESYEYTFAAKADLSQPRHNYKLKAWTEHADDLIPGNNAVEASVRHLAQAVVPYKTGFEPDEDISLMKFANLNNDDGEWSVNFSTGSGMGANFQRTGFGYLGYNYNSDNNADDWAFLEPIAMEAGYYVLKFWYSATENHTERMRVCYGNAPTPEAMIHELADYEAVTNSKYKEAIHIFELKEAGDVYVGFYCYSDKDENWLVIDDLSIDKVDADWFDIKVDNLSSPTSFMRAGSLTDIKFNLENLGVVDANVDVNVYLDGSLLKKASYAVRGREILPVVMENALDGISQGKHILKIEALSEGDDEQSNNVVEKEIIVLEKAVALWDFEDGKLPSDLTLRKGNSAVNHPDCGDEFNEDGFGIFKLQNPILGKYALAVNTWFTEVRYADTWVVLPQMTVSGNDAYFVWNANSYNDKFPESYEVKVSTGEDKWTVYSTIYNVVNESASPQTHGVSLAEYKDKNIYVAINIRTSNGEALVLDNLGVYGDIRLASSGISGMEVASECKFAVEGDELKVYGAEVESINVYGLDGALLVSVQGDSADISALASGLYVARAMTSEGVVSAKFVK